MKIIGDTVTNVLIGVLLFLTVALVGVRVFGLEVYSVLSGSMEPTYPTGSLLYVKKADHTALGAGEVITFMLNEDTVVTHRITEVITDAEDTSILRFRTKGDANANEDINPVHYKNIIGTPVLAIPYLGYVASMIQSPLGTYGITVLCAFLLLWLFLPDRLFEGLQKEEKKATATEEKSLHLQA